MPGDFFASDEEKIRRTIDNIELVERATSSIIMAHWKVFSALTDISDLEGEGVMVEAIIPAILYGLKRMCKRHGIDFNLVLNDSVQLEKLTETRTNRIVN